MESEIKHLLQYIESSDCTFNRNGRNYDGKEAAAHIRKKFSHTKRWIKSTADFIAYAATKSSLSGRAYQVTCNGSPMPTAEWLADELNRLRDITR